MVKFEVGKVYETSNLLEQRVLQKVIARSKHFLITKTIKGCGVSEWENELSHVISVVNGVEVCMNPFRQQELSADREANIQEKKKEEVESDDFIVGKEYEAINLATKCRFKVKLYKKDPKYLFPLMFRDVAGNEGQMKSDGDIAYYGLNWKNIVVFKHGIKSILDWEEAKEERELVCFEAGKEYKACSKDSDTWELKAIIDVNDGKVGIFYNKRTDIILRPTIKTLNSVEYTTYGNLEHTLDFIADEQYRDEIHALI